MFTIPKSLLDKKIQFFISMKNLQDGFTPFPNVVAGTTGRVDDSLKKMFFNPGNSAGMLFPIEYNTQSPIYPEIGQSKSIV